MSTRPSIRESAPGDCDAIECLYPEAFPDEDLVPLVRDLLKGPASVLSLVATIDSQVAGHVIFTRCDVDGSVAALLGPLAVAPNWQRQGIGSTLVHTGLQRLDKWEVKVVCVLGDPSYYGRFGFERDSSIKPPYTLPSEWRDAWQSLNTGTPEPITGKLVLPDTWMQPALWLP